MAQAPAVLLEKNLHLLLAFSVSEFKKSLSANIKISSEKRKEFKKRLAACHAYAFSIIRRRNNRFDSNSASSCLPSVSKLLKELQNIPACTEGSLTVAFKNCLEQLEAINPEKKHFECTKTSDEKATEALDDYIKYAEMIRKSTDFEESHFGYLEKMLKDKQRTCEELFPEIFENQPISTDAAFIALAAPSFEGKTQSAFVLKEVKPLYFSFCDTDRNPQSIYVNYTSLSNRLRNLASNDDFKALEKYVKGLPAPRPDKDEMISASFLVAHNSIKFWSLGFLKSLIDHLRTKSESNWMKLLAGDLKFSYQKLSVEECITKEYFKDICLFLDEFAADPWLIMLRNLARACKLNCLVANTNSRIANVLGKRHSSGSNGELVWSIVFTKLNAADIDLLNEYFDFAKNIHAIKLRYHQGSRHSRNHPVDLFLDSLVSTMIRPGVALVIARTLKKFVQTKLSTIKPNSSVVLLVDFVASHLAQAFVDRKDSMQYEDDGHLAKLALSLSQSYVSVDASTNELNLQISEDNYKLFLSKFTNKGEFLKDHLFYLSNPQGAQSDVFLTFGPKQSPKSLQKANSNANNRKKLKKHLRVLCNGSMTPWLLELTHFDQDDLGTLIGCLFVQLLASIGMLFMYSTLKDNSNPGRRLLSALNENLKSNNSGNELEIIVASIITESSRHEHVNRKNFSFSGQNGQEFIRNIVRILVLQTVANGEVILDMPPNYTVEVKFHNVIFNLELFFKSCRIPFVYGWNSTRQPVLSKLSELDPEFNVANLERCANKSQIDASLPCFFGNNKEKGSIAFECKNFHHKVSCTQLVSILSKALNSARPEEASDCPRLSMVFANSFYLVSAPKSKRANAAPANRVIKAKTPGRKPKTTPLPSLSDYCKSKQINLYRVIKISTRHFQIIPFEAKSPIHSAPKMVCLLFESERINTTHVFNKKK